MSEDYVAGTPTSPDGLRTQIEVYNGLAEDSRQKGNLLDAEAYASYAGFMKDRLNGVERCGQCGHKLRKPRP